MTEADPEVLGGEAADEIVKVLPHTEWAAARVAPAFVALSCAHEASPEAIVQDAPVNGVTLEDHEDMAGCVHAFDTLRSAALTPDRSRTFIRKSMNGMVAENEES
ncbi:Scr1 family TA system antitoxin-like transcriptional regulator [Streptomyces sp. NBC_00893]|uniref:Scr1 family TA system antitoxin-like transcriptional regulator n=1 Tax=Streptomyces sp. NBC_00893 TaxID=2975862 RepID=UPI00225B25E6|nr:Scr1 family TA system antitoxin-like transcriptional regulator [Streptomyces sp. NBC_00893]MCX4848005.1 Scr1 family TA system antitoxin-like transcriptional regulator [Streptomyces sp. NBC_00893]